MSRATLWTMTITLDDGTEFEYMDKSYSNLAKVEKSVRETETVSKVYCKGELMS